MKNNFGLCALAGCLLVLMVFGSAITRYRRTQPIDVPLGRVLRARDLDESNIQALINEKGRDGDTILLPPGRATWTNFLVVTNKDVTVLGNTPPMVTIIEDTAYLSTGEFWFGSRDTNVIWVRGGSSIIYEPK